MVVCRRLVLLGIITASLILPSLCQAAISGDCSVCHTMHNSEDNVSVAYTLDSSGQKLLNDQPFPNLLKTDCLGCHTHLGAATIITIGESVVPVIFNLTEPTYPPNGSVTSTLAGGNFHWIIKSGEEYGHNVQGIADPDSRFLEIWPPGAVTRTDDCINCHKTLSTVQSGCEGCHVPLHHTDSADVVTGSEKGWFRFLGSVMQRDDQVGPPTEGVVGIEDPSWEQNPLADQHNTYQGDPGPYVSYLETGSINQKCTGCHGRFHNETVADSTWIRHPDDVAIPDSGEFAAFTTYNPMVPVARQNVNSNDAGFTVINRGSDLVTCISCHRAHGSPYPAMLRWGYRDWPGDDSHTGQPAQNGCAVCHTTKD